MNQPQLVLQNLVNAFDDWQKATSADREYQKQETGAAWEGFCLAVEIARNHLMIQGAPLGDFTPVSPARLGS